MPWVSVSFHSRPVACRCARWPIVLLLVLFAALPSAAKECGDRIDGQRSACACGDIVVSDTILRASDPVIRERCLGSGLTIRAGDLADTITLDLDGLSLVGSGVGDGIAVEFGGNDGASIRGGTTAQPGQIVGFGIGLNVKVARAAKQIEALRLAGHRHEGLALRMAGALVFDVRADHNGGDGIRVTGQGGRLLRVEAVANAGTGIRLASRYTIVEGRADENHEHGFVVRGSRNELGHSSATKNKGYGALVSGPNQGVGAVTAQGNRVGGVATAANRRRTR